MTFHRPFGFFLSLLVFINMYSGINRLCCMDFYYSGPVHIAVAKSSSVCVNAIIVSKHWLPCPMQHAFCSICIISNNGISRREVCPLWRNS